MNKKNLMPQPSQPVNRIIAGQLPDVLAELSEDALELRGEAFEALVSTSILIRLTNNDFWEEFRHQGIPLTGGHVKK